MCVAQYLEKYIHYINLISKFEKNVFTSLLVKIWTSYYKLITFKI